MGIRCRAPPTPGKTEVVRKEEPDGELVEEEELPEPDDNPTLIFQALKRQNVCFYHAKGLKCPHRSKPSDASIRTMIASWHEDITV